MIKTLRPYQKTVVETLKKRLKEVKHPLLINMSVGAGKSLVIASLLEWLSSKNYRALCLTLNSTLIQQNYNTYKAQGMDAGIYCAGLEAKDTVQSVIFGSPHSMCQAIRNKEEISKQKFNIIVVDEAHNINPHDPSTMYQRIINHYGHLAQQEQYSYRVVGLTGTPYRNKAESIIGEHAFFKEEICNISTSWLINQGYLVRPEFGLCHEDAYDFSQLRTNNMGKFNQKELQAAIDKKERLTGQIMRELQTIKCNGVFIFAATRRHCEECARSLPDGEWAIITGETKHEDRKRFLEAAKIGDIRYLISVGCLNVGVDIPFFDVCAWLRPTESLVLYTQGIGRVLRLHEGKHKAIVVDFAGNLSRHGDIDDPIINEALKPTAQNEKDYIIPCYTCGTNNTIHARRCIGIVVDKRCDHYFQFKDCNACGIANDTTSRHCRGCGHELIDPNSKLTRIETEQYEFEVDKAEYWIVQTPNEYECINIIYHCQGKRIYEYYKVGSTKSINIFYARFVRQHYKNPSQFYMNLRSKLYEMIYKTEIITPHKIICKTNESNNLVVIKKVFQTNQPI